MHFRTLSSMVAAATQEAERHIKMASAADAVRTGEDFDIQKLAEDGFPPEATDKKESKSKDDKDKKETRDDSEKKAAVDYAMKLAEALRIAAPMVEKLAEQSHTDAPGPAVMAAPQVGAQHLPKPPKAKTDPGKTGVGATGTLATNKTAAWTQDRAAGTAYVQAKLAQAELLAKLGQAEAAEHILSKLAQDPSSPQPSLPENNGSAGALTLMPDVPSGRMPESPAAIASMTRATAKDPTTKTVSEFIAEAPKKDNMVAPTQMTAQGLKVSHVLEKLAAKQEAELEKVAVSRSRIVAAVQKSLPERLAKAGDTSYSSPVIRKALARSNLRSDRLNAMLNDLPDRVRTQTPAWKSQGNELALRNAIHSARDAAELGVRG